MLINYLKIDEKGTAACLSFLKDLGKDLVVSLGVFDGLHLGHRFVLETAIDLANSLKSLPAVITFYPLPNSLFKKQAAFLTPKNEKILQLKKLGLSRIFFLNFSPKFSLLTYKEFLEILRLMKIKGVVVGFNFSFGYKALGTPDDLAKYFKTVVVKPFLYNEKLVSSSRILDLLSLGKIEEANEFLGRFYTIKGKVVFGNKIGNKLGFNTANILLEENYFLPKDGVYIVKVTSKSAFNSFYFGVMNIGKRPTILSNNTRSIEVHLFDFQGNLYGKRLSVELLSYLREEKKFTSLLALKEQIKRDVFKAKLFLKEKQLKFNLHE